MKKIIASILTVLTIGASAQLTYVTTIDDYVETSMDIDYDGSNFIDNNKYLTSEGNWNETNRVNDYYDIINSDFSLYKRIKIDTTNWIDLSLEFGDTARGAYSVSLGSIFFSDHVYNSDDKVEVIYFLQQTVYDINELGYYENYRDVPIKTIVIDENGVVLQTINNVGIDMEGLFQLNGKTYFQVKNEEDKFDIYEATGNMPCKTCSSSEVTPTQKAPEKIYDINVFPNPTTNQITLAINTDKTGMKVHIYATDGKLVKSASVVNGNNLIDTADLVAGNYIYNVQTDTEVIHASQFIKK